MIDSALIKVVAGNGGDGVFVDGEAGHVIGGTRSARYARNLIAANGGDGIELDGAVRSETDEMEGSRSGLDRSLSNWRWIVLRNPQWPTRFAFARSPLLVRSGSALEESCRPWRSRLSAQRRHAR